MYRNSLIIAYIKELLHNFNLPMMPVLTDETVPYYGRMYVQDHKVGSYNHDHFEPLYDYVRNYKVVNLTKNFIINSSDYDEYTHNYLGEYLRFIRDYDGINLMSMYNCFFKQQPRRLNYKPESGSSSEVMTINTDDISYNYYLVPVKFNQKYTISISSPAAYEVAMVIHNNQFLSKTPAVLVKQSYKRIYQTSAKIPVLYDAHVSDENGKDLGETLWPFEEKLRLLIKIPASIKSTITILEGNWLNNSSYTCGVFVDSYACGDASKNYISKSSLIRTNDNIQRPFSDRLVEYLLFNAIASNEFIDNNIKRVQDLLYDVHQGIYGVWSDQLRKDLYSILYESNLMLGNRATLGASVYSLDSGELVTVEKRLIDSCPDTLGFVDKDLERQLELRRLKNG